MRQIETQLNRQRDRESERQRAEATTEQKQYSSLQKR